MSNFKAKMRQIQFQLGLCPRPCWGSLQRSPTPLVGYKRPTSEGRGVEGEKGGVPSTFLRIYAHATIIILEASWLNCAM